MQIEYHHAILKDRFQIFLKSNHKLTSFVQNAKLDLAFNEIEFEAHETDEFDWINWLLKMPEDESIVVFFVDEYENTQCMLNLGGLYVNRHSFNFSNTSHESLFHAIKIQFSKIERILVDKPFQKPKALISNLA